MPEFDYLAPENRVEVVSLLREKLQELGVTHTAWDFDGTLIDSSANFHQAILDASGILLFGQEWIGQSANGFNPLLDKAQEFSQTTLREIGDRLKLDLGISPIVWELSTIAAARVAGIDIADPRVEQAAGRIRAVYKKDIPPVFEGAIETVDIFNATGLPSFLMTHAEEEWTRRKRDSTGFTGRFASVVCFSIHRPKSEQWAPNFKALNLNPEQALVLGDSFEADIVPTALLGAHTIWVKNTDGPGYHLEAPRVFDPKSFKRQVITAGPVGNIIRTLLETSF